MQAIVTKERRERFLIALVLLIVVTVIFWTSSRYPSLGDKALMAGSIQLEDPLSFEANWPIDPNDPLWEKIYRTTLNWLHTNRKGMTFGILMGAIFLTLMRYLERISFKNGFLNALTGLFLGAPLGVCVNCAAPIAKGLYSGGARAETMLAAMIASPTLNIVVLTMLFSILPFYIAITKVILCLLIIVIAVPVICRFLPEDQRQISPDKLLSKKNARQQVTEKESIAGALIGFLKDITSDLFYIICMTLPLMILAGFLGAVVATLIPIETLNTATFGLSVLIIIAIIGTFLPVPIAFDIVICGALLAGGLAVGSVMTLLFTLGIFSIYSFFIVAQSVSWRASFLVAIVIIFTGTLAGLGVDKWHTWKTEEALELLTTQTSGPIINSEGLDTNSAGPDKRLASAYETETNSETESSAITIEKTPFSEKSPDASTLFTRLEAHQIGIDKPIEFSFKDMWPPYWEGRSISAGDFDKDGDQDLVFASTENGLYLYQNDGSGRFIRTDPAIGRLKDLPIFNAALVDINNDGWLDLFLTTYRSGNYVLWNEGGSYDSQNLSVVKNRDDTPLSLALSFADVDRDGDLDVALGNWAAGWYRRVPGFESQNRIVFNDDGNLSGQDFFELPGIPGETLSILFSDIDSDGDADLLVGNDFEIPDVFYLGDGKGKFEQITRQDNIIPVTTHTTMAIKSHDLDNDLIPEIYMAQISGRSSGISDRLNMQPIENYCDAISLPDQKRICEKNMAIKVWYRSGNSFDPSLANKCLGLDSKYEGECKAMLVKDLAIQAEDPSICDFIHADQPEIQSFCKLHFKPSRPFTNEDVANNFRQIKRHNVLLSRQENGVYADISVEHGLEVGGWSWDTKVADYDNDGWSDIYIVNGTWVPNEFTPSNMFFLNSGNGDFTELASESGLEDFSITAAAVNVDIDHDGDLDIISVPVNAPVQAFINNSQSGHAINFRFEDEFGNYFGVGTRIAIYYGANAQHHQIREIQSGGGFQSFDSAYAHFGLGEFQSVQRIEVFWADGSESSITTPLEAGATYTIRRDNAQAN